MSSSAVALEGGEHRRRPVAARAAGGCAACGAAASGPAATSSCGFECTGKPAQALPVRVPRVHVGVRARGDDVERAVVEQVADGDPVDRVAHVAQRRVAAVRAAREVLRVRAGRSRDRQVVDTGKPGHLLSVRAQRVDVAVVGGEDEVKLVAALEVDVARARPPARRRCGSGSRAAGRVVAHADRTPVLGLQPVAVDGPAAGASPCTARARPVAASSRGVRVEARAGSGEVERARAARRSVARRAAGDRVEVGVGRVGARAPTRATSGRCPPDRQRLGANDAADRQPCAGAPGRRTGTSAESRSRPSAGPVRT